MLKKDAANILGIPVTPFTMDEAVSYITSSVEDGKQLLTVTANAEIIMLAQNDERYKKLLINKADLILPDGAGTVWGGNHLGYHIPERVAGYDLFLRLLEEASTKNIKVFLFGGVPGIAEAAAIEGQKRFPGLKITGTHNGYFTDADVPAIIDEINKSEAQMLFAALGAPKQEYWLSEHAQELKPRLLMGLGGSFDVLAGKVKRAPQWMQEAKLEWLYRLLKQPSRFTRMLVLPQFVLKILTAKKSK
jgi:N-acetylglucosaminyldiphosphoundecaprenol N-acetyl-beta-D-mannosaminyltransferase